VRLLRWTALFALLNLTDYSISSQQIATARNGIPAIPLCELLRTPLSYAGKTVTTVARIDRFKEVTGIWDPACRNLGADLHTQDSDRSTLAMKKLAEELNKAGMGDHPVIATLTGTWLPNQITKNGFLPQPRLVFLVSDASNIGRSKKVERR
jgi:hypothetical protein